ncbi:hypothetical protein DM860_017759 [Cuscuta australis]|uniref:Coatomer subunit zeta n=1 Tax=Cuscuta australis TaxID=267555 RepID=A0A328DDP4_9ASTE|nr:hypothetical protein DM860_017759 [Cuscuta australis]
MLGLVPPLHRYTQVNFISLKPSMYYPSHLDMMSLCLHIFLGYDIFVASDLFLFSGGSSTNIESPLYDFLSKTPFALNHGSCHDIMNMLLLDSEGKHIFVKYYNKEWPTISVLSQ